VRILVIDDDVELANLLGEFLRREGFTLDFEHDGRKGLEVVMEGLPAGREPLSTITIDIVGNDTWVYVLRSYSPKTRDAKERPLFAYFRDHFHMTGPQEPPAAPK